MWPTYTRQPSQPFFREHSKIRLLITIGLFFGGKTGNNAKTPVLFVEKCGTLTHVTLATVVACAVQPSLDFTHAHARASCTTPPPHAATRMNGIKLDRIRAAKLKRCTIPWAFKEHKLVDDTWVPQHNVVRFVPGKFVLMAPTHSPGTATDKAHVVALRKCMLDSAQGAAAPLSKEFFRQHRQGEGFEFGEPTCSCRPWRRGTGGSGVAVAWQWCGSGVAVVAWQWCGSGVANWLAIGWQLAGNWLHMIATGWQQVPNWQWAGNGQLTGNSSLATGVNWMDGSLKKVASQLPANCQPLGWQLAGNWLATGWQLAGNWMATGWQLAGNWLATGWQLAGNWLATGWLATSQLPASCQPIASQLPANCQPIASQLPANGLHRLATGWQQVPGWQWAGNGQWTGNSPVWQLVSIGWQFEESWQLVGNGSGNVRSPR